MRCCNVSCQIVRLRFCVPELSVDLVICSENATRIRVPGKFTVYAGRLNGSFTSESRVPASAGEIARCD